MDDICYKPDAHGLTPVAEVEWRDEPYEFDMTVVWLVNGSDPQEFVWASDSGGSCPSPFEDFTSLDTGCRRLRRDHAGIVMTTDQGTASEGWRERLEHFAVHVANEPAVEPEFSALLAADLRAALAAVGNNERAYRDGENSANADWQFALGEWCDLPDDVAPVPTQVAHYIARLQATEVAPERVEAMWDALIRLPQVQDALSRVMVCSCGYKPADEPGDPAPPERDCPFHGHPDAAVHATLGAVRAALRGHADAALGVLTGGSS